MANISAPVDVELVKRILTSTHTNTYHWIVCDCPAAAPPGACPRLYNYPDLVRRCCAPSCLATVSTHSRQPWHARLRTASHPHR